MNPNLYGEHIVFGTEYTLADVEAPVLFLDTANGGVVRT